MGTFSLPYSFIIISDDHSKNVEKNNKKDEDNDSDSEDNDSDSEDNDSILSDESEFVDEIVHEVLLRKSQNLTNSSINPNESNDSATVEIESNIIKPKFPPVNENSKFQNILITDDGNFSGTIKGEDKRVELRCPC